MANTYTCLIHIKRKEHDNNSGKGVTDNNPSNMNIVPSINGLSNSRTFYFEELRKLEFQSLD